MALPRGSTRKMPIPDLDNNPRVRDDLFHASEQQHTEAPFGAWYSSRVPLASSTPLPTVVVSFVSAAVIDPEVAAD
jgi:hypothetical protein